MPSCSSSQGIPAAADNGAGRCAGKRRHFGPALGNSGGCAQGVQGRPGRHTGGRLPAYAGHDSYCPIGVHTLSLYRLSVTEHIHVCLSLCTCASILQKDTKLGQAHFDSSMQACVRVTLFLPCAAKSNPKFLLVYRRSWRPRTSPPPLPHPQGLHQQQNPPRRRH